MATYRVGNRYLSEKEYRKEMDQFWAFLLFVVAGCMVGIPLFLWLWSLGAPKIVFLGGSIAAGLCAGALATKYSRQIGSVLILILVVAACWEGGKALWQAVPEKPQGKSKPASNATVPHTARTS